MIETWVGGIAIYVVIWWTVIFAVLPFGVHPISAEDVAKGHAAGAPRQPRVLFKAAVTSVVAAVIWLIFYWVIEAGAIRFID
jgi:predicted secreted protein